MNVFLIFLNMVVVAPRHSQRNDVVATREGLIAVTAYQMPASRKARNSWDRLSFSKDEGNDGTMPLIDVRKGGL